MLKRKNIPIHESTYVCTSLGLVSGFLEAYTFLLKGGVFCNAQTGNIAMLGIYLAKADLSKIIQYTIPIIAYVVGIAITVITPKLLGKKSISLRWETVFIAIEIIILFAIGFMPDSVPYIVPNVLISFICAMKYNTFRKHNSVILATTFCTNNLRQASLNIIEWIKTKDKQYILKSLDFIVVNLAFMLGAVIGTLSAMQFEEKSIWLACVILIPVFISLLLFNKNPKEAEI